MEKSLTFFSILTAGKQNLNPKSLTARLRKDSEFLDVNLLHEYFGHGTYIEHSIPGMEIQRLEDEGSADPLVEQLEWDIEGFAMWIEHFLSERTGRIPLFERKMDEVIGEDHKSIFEAFLNFTNEYGRLALFGEMELPKHYEEEEVVDTIRRLSKEKFGNIDLGILYGSRQPYSDIDIFLVSPDIESRHYGWLDVYAKSREEFESRLLLLDILITDPIMTGSQIIGEETLQRHYRRILHQEPITEEAISHNLARADEERSKALEYRPDTKGRLKGLKNSRIYRMNARELETGKKPLSLQALKRNV